MSEEVLDANQQQYCDVAEDMTKSMASTRELVRALREKYGLYAPAVWYGLNTYNLLAQTRKDI